MDVSDHKASASGAVYMPFQGVRVQRDKTKGRVSTLCAAVVAAILLGLRYSDFFSNEVGPPPTPDRPDDSFDWDAVSQLPQFSP